MFRFKLTHSLGRGGLTIERAIRSVQGRRYGRESRGKNFFDETRRIRPTTAIYQAVQDAARGGLVCLSVVGLAEGLIALMIAPIFDRCSIPALQTTNSY